MPNHIQNILTITADSKEELQIFLSSIKSEDREYIDFNRIIPMPTEIRETESSSKTDLGVFYYLYKTNQLELVPTILHHCSLTPDFIATKTPEELNSLYEQGERYVGYYKQYGAKDWYDWSNANWGTKWNAYETDCCLSLDKKCATIRFQTAWNGVLTLIGKLTEMFPNLTFNYDYADEDGGYNCGSGWGQDGEFSYRLLTGGSNEAIEHYIRCWGYEDVYYKNKNGEWVSRDEECDEDYDEE